MNRHERRAAEAQTRNSFKDYDALYRRAFNKVDDRDIGESWMRGAAAEAEGIKGMILHAPNEAPPPRDQCDLELSAAYGSQQFIAYAKSGHIKTLEEQWPVFVKTAHAVPNNPLTGDARSDARQFIFEMIMTNWPYANGDMAALTASAIVWLARSSPAGLAIGKSHKHIYYEITEMGTAPDGAEDAELPAHAERLARALSAKAAMYKRTQDQTDHLERTGSAATRPSARGVFKAIPSWAREPEEYYLNLHESYNIANRQLFQLRSRAAWLKFRVETRQASPGELLEYQNDVSPMLEKLERELDLLRHAVTTAAKSAWSEIFFFHARQLLDDETFERINAKVEEIVQRHRMPERLGRLKPCGKDMRKARHAHWP
jgi:hypothetical protein